MEHNTTNIAITAMADYSKNPSDGTSDEMYVAVTDYVLRHGVDDKPLLSAIARYENAQLDGDTTTVASVLYRSAAEYFGLVERPTECVNKVTKPKRHVMTLDEATREFEAWRGIQDMMSGNEAEIFRIAESFLFHLKE